MSNILEVILDLVDNMTPGLDAANSAVDNLSNNVDNASTAIDNFDPTNIESVGEAAESAGLDLQQIGEAASMAGVDISSIDPSNIGDTASKSKDAAGSGEEMASAFGLVEGALSALVGVGIGAFLDEIIDKATGSVDSWNLLGAVLSQQGVSLDSAKSEIIGLANEHGFLTKNVREATKVLTQAGMSYQDVTKDGGAMNAAMAISVATGRDLTDSAVQLQRAYMGNGRALKLLGIDIDDYKNKSTGMVDREALNAAILQKLGGQLNTYGDSYEALSTRLENAWSKLETSLGKLVLPIITPVIEAITWAVDGLANAVSGLDPFIQGVMGAVLLFGGALTSAYLIIAPIVKLLGPMLTPILSALGIEVGGVGGAFGALAGVLSGPVGWAILAIVAAVAAAIYIWQNWSDEIIKFKDAIMGGDWGSAAGMIVSAFSFVGQSIYDVFVYAGQQIWTFLTNLPAMIGENATNWITMGRNFITWLIQGLTSISGYLTQVMTQMLQPSQTGAAQAGQETGETTGKGLIEGFNQWVLDNAQLIYDTLNLLFNTLMPLIGQLILQLAALIAIWMLQTGQKAANDFINSFIQYLSQLPGRVLATLMQTVLTIFIWAGQLVMLAWQIGSSFVNNFILFLSQLPGRAWSIFLQFLAYLGSLPGRAYSYAVSTANSIVSGMGAYLQSLPGRMYQWGMNALGRFVDGIINSIPGLRAALDTVRSLFPNSPPKEGPLSKITYGAMYNWMSGIMGAGMDAIGTFDMNSINTTFPNATIPTSGSSGGNQLVIQVDVTGLSNVDNKEIASEVKRQVADSKVIRVIDKGLGKLQGHYSRSTGG